MSMSSYDPQQGVEVGRFESYTTSMYVDKGLSSILTAHMCTGVRERHLESLLESSLSQIILVKDFPRCLIQIVLQIESAPANDYVNTKLVQAGIVRRPNATPSCVYLLITFR